MSQENIQTDTQSNVEQQYNSLEEAVFSNTGSDDIASAFTSGNEGNTEPAPNTGQPEVSTQENVQQPVQTNNDETRYQYWQSQADKYKNELESLKQQQSVTAEPVAPAQPAEPVVEEFPAAPEKPQRPRMFSREEAYSDPNSESARYLDELEGWRDDISEYNSLKSQYQTALMEEKFNKIEQSRIEAAQKQEAAQKKAAQEAEVRNHVMGHYGMSQDEAVDFMSKMSDPSSITIDNLVQLYRMQKGEAAPVANTSVPSDAFTQTKNAQQVPSPMGVMPSGQSNADTVSFEDKIMDTMIGNFNSKNPWK